MAKEKLTVKTTLPFTEAVAYMEDLVASLKAGTIVVQNEGEHVTLKPGSDVSIEVEAKIKKDKQKFGFEISWVEPGETSLIISDSLPPAKKQKGEMVESEPAEVPAEKVEAKTPSKTEDASKAKKKAKPKAAKKGSKKPAKGKAATKK